jgi:UDP-3-O-[3-hydroxymyristoyl] N-acetylglucosamine deacetylase
MRVVVDGNEMPIMDGSAISFCLLIEEAGIQKQNSPKKIIRVKQPVEIQEGAKFVRLLPHESAKFDFRIDFDHPVIGEQEEHFEFSTKSFVQEIARARTFGFAKDIQYLQSQNLALGATLQNAIGLDDHKILNPEGLRFENEFAKHKVLDAMGDMMVSGHNILGKYESFAGSHDLNYKLTSKLLSDEKNYDLIAVEELQSRVFEKSFA